jgi:hypothetical protein
MERERKNEKAEACPIFLLEKIHDGSNICGATSFSMDVNESKNGNTGAFLRVSKFFRQKRTKRRRDGGGCSPKANCSLAPFPASGKNTGIFLILTWMLWLIILQSASIQTFIAFSSRCSACNKQGIFTLVSGNCIH